MKRSYIGLAATVMFVAGCATVTVPVDRRVRASEVCGPLATRKCAPTHGPYLVFNRQQKTIPVGADGVPEVMGYLGRIIPVGERSGSTGTTCGGGASPFTLDDRQDSTFANTINVDYTLTSNTTAQLKADLLQALIVSGVPKEVTDQLEGELEITVGRLKNQSSKATGVFTEWFLKQSALDALDFADSAAPPEPRLKPCLDELKTGGWRLYRGVSGLYVSNATLDSSTTNSIVANLAVKVKALKPDVDLAALTADLNTKATTRIHTSSAPYFVVLGVSFYKSDRHSMIR